MMNGIRILALGLCGLISNVAMATEIFVWDSTPIELKLEVGKERIIHFPTNVSLGMNPQLRKHIKIGNSGGKLYMTPMRSIPKTRIQVRLEDGQIIYVDMFAGRPEGTQLQEDVKIVFPDQVQEEKQAFGLVEEPKRGISDIKLAQYASIHKYGVQRLLPNLPITVNEVTRPLTLDFVFGGGSAALFDMHAETQYRTQRYTLTAIKLTNRTHRVQPVKVTDIPAFHLGAVPQHVTVGPKGSNEESTHLYLITPKPLAEYKEFSAMIDTAESKNGS